MCDRATLGAGDELRDYWILFRWCIPDLVASRRFTVVISAGRGSRNRNQADDRDPKPATPFHPARPRNQQVKDAETLMRARRGTTALPR